MIRRNRPLLINKIYLLKEARCLQSHKKLSLVLGFENGNMSITDKNIPQQKQGNQVDIQHQVTFETYAEAGQLFEAAKQRLLNISHWREIIDGVSSDFQLVNNGGQDVDRPAQIGDHFKIHIPAPGPDSGNGNDWVRIEAIQDETDTKTDLQIASIRVRPAANPQKPNQEVAHFFSEDSTSTFVVKRIGNMVSAEVHGRNEVPNLHANGVLDTVRHVAVAVGAILGFSDKQWQNLVEGLLTPKKQA